MITEPTNYPSLTRTVIPKLVWTLKVTTNFIDSFLGHEVLGFPLEIFKGSDYVIT